MLQSHRLVQTSLDTYKSLWGTNEYARMKMLTHLWFVNGCGYEWHKGNIIDACPRLFPKDDVEDALDKSISKQENDHAPHLHDWWDEDYSLIGTIPEDAKKQWRKLANETLTYYLQASFWHFPTTETGMGFMYKFSAAHTHAMKKKLRNLEEKLMARFPDWKQAEDLDKVVMEDIKKRLHRGNR